MMDSRRFVVVSLEPKNLVVAGPAAALVADLEKGLVKYCKPGSVFKQDKDKEQPEVFIPHNVSSHSQKQFLLAVLNLCSVRV